MECKICQEPVWFCSTCNDYHHLEHKDHKVSVVQDNPKEGKEQ